MDRRVEDDHDDRWGVAAGFYSPACNANIMGTSAFDRVDRRELGAGLAGSLAGAVALGGILTVAAGAGSIRRFGALVGADGAGAAWGVLVAACLVLSLGFAAFVSRTASPFTTVLFGLTRRSDLLRRLLLPVVRRAAYPAAALVLGLWYGLLVGVGFGAVVMPAWLSAAGFPTAVPLLDPAGIAAWIAYGGALGVVFATLTER